MMLKRGLAIIGLSVAMLGASLSLPQLAEQPHTHPVIRQLAERELNTVFAERRQAASEYADQVYNWASGYVTAYHIMGTAMLAMVQNPGDWRTAVPQAIRDFHARRIEQKVTRPERGAQQVTDLIDRQIDAVSYLLIEEEIRVRCHDSADRQCRQLANEASLAAMAAPLAAQRALDGERFARLKQLFTLQPNSDDYSFQTLRPLFTRMFMIIARFIEIVTGFAILRGIVNADIWVLRWVLTLLLVWSVDFCINKVDESLHKQAFLERLDGVILRQHMDVNQYVMGEIEGAQKQFEAALGGLKLGSL